LLLVQALVDVDRRKMGHAMRQILAHAIDCTPEGGDVGVELRLSATSSGAVPAGTRGTLTRDDDVSTAAAAAAAAGAAAGAGAGAGSSPAAGLLHVSQRDLLHLVEAHNARQTVAGRLRAALRRNVRPLPGGRQAVGSHAQGPHGPAGLTLSPRAVKPKYLVVEVCSPYLCGPYLIT